MARPISGKYATPYTITCSHPGCTTRITLKRKHTYAAGLCQVHLWPDRFKKPEPVEAVSPPVPRVPVRVAVVHLVPGCSSLASERLVSLPREPWHHG
jgi:hypothetical protein